MKDCVRLLEEGDYALVASMMLDYYDKLYQKWAKESLNVREISVECVTLDAKQNALLVLKASEATQSSSEKKEEKEEVEELLEQPLEQLLELSVAGSCFCGEVEILCRGSARAASYCHCSVCRRLSGAAFTCQALFDAEQVELKLQPGASLTSLRTSKGPKDISLESNE